MNLFLFRCSILFYPLFCFLPYYMPSLYPFQTANILNYKWKTLFKMPPVLYNLHIFTSSPPFTFPYGVSAIRLWECAGSRGVSWCHYVQTSLSLSLSLCPSTSSLPVPGQSASHYRRSIRQYLCTEQTHIEMTPPEHEAAAVVWL